MQFKELEQQEGKLKPHLSAEGLMLVELFMPFCRELHEKNKQLKAGNKRLRDQLSQNSRNSSRPPSKDYGRAQKGNVSNAAATRKAGEIIKFSTMIPSALHFSIALSIKLA